MSIQRRLFGTMPDGQTVDAYTLGNPRLRAVITTYGGRIQELHAPDRAGGLGNIVLGFDSLEPCLRDTSYLGTIVGRVCNRIAHGRFRLDGVEYHLPKNDGDHTLHGGLIGFDKVVWSAEPRDDANRPALVLRHVSPDGSDGFPGTVYATVTYTLDGDCLQIDYHAVTDRPTPINLTNHAYFNLKGPGCGDILDHVLYLAASRYTPCDREFLPSGEIAPAAGTAYDFTSPKPIGRDLPHTPGGYDTNFVLDTAGRIDALAGRLFDPTTGRVLEMRTTEPGVQLYSGNFLDGAIKGLGGIYHRHGALCLETQHFPDSVNRPNFPNTILRPGQTYRSTTIYRCTVEKG